MTTDPALVPSPARHPKVFISYSWDSDAHKQWVLELAEALANAGVDVILDKWSLHPGQDQIRFMEEAIANSDHVLVICTLAYADKANSRDGGAGYETTILTASLVENLDTKKFIPILREGHWGISGSVPRWLASRAGIDLRGTPFVDENFQELVQTLHGQLAGRPPLGKIPTFDKVDPLPVPKPAPKLPHAGRPASGLAVRLKADLGLDAKEIELLWHAAHDAGGQVAHIKAIGGDCLSANNQTFPEQRDARSHSEWFGALHNLESAGLLEAVGFEPDYYRLTALGWETSDALGEFAIWKATEITVERRYLGSALPEMVILSCRRIVRLPAEFNSDGYSVKEPMRLVVEGIDPGDPHLQRGLAFEPTHACFRDPATGEEIWLHLYSESEVRGRTLRLQING